MGQDVTADRPRTCVADLTRKVLDSSSHHDGSASGLDRTLVVEQGNPTVTDTLDLDHIAE